ncbi:MAG: glycosyltransferase family 4 protein [Cyanobacteria bacterium J06638_22]
MNENESIDNQSRDDMGNHSEPALVSRIQVLTDEMTRMDAHYKDKIREIREQNRDEIAQTRSKIENQLSYRFGRQLLRALKNPVRLIALPIALAKEWAAFRQQRKSAREQASSPQNPEHEQKTLLPSVSLEIARQLKIESLSRLKDEQLLRLMTTANKSGEAWLNVNLAAARWLRTRDESAGHTLRHKRGHLVELNTSWLPPLSRRSHDVPNPNKILHIFKTIYPIESSGGAVRNRSIVVHQKNLGLDPVVSVAPTKLPRSLVAHRALADGLFSMDNEGIETWLCHFKNFARDRIPRDSLLTFETKMLAHAAEHINPSLIHAASGLRGYDNALKGIALSRSREIPFVYEVRSFHEHTWSTLFDGILDTEMTQLRVAQENRCMNNADAVVTISNAMADEIVKRGVERDRIFVVPNSVDEEFLKPIPEETVRRFKQRWNIVNQLVVGYISNISKREGHKLLCDAFVHFRERHPNARLLIVGNGPANEDLQQHISKLGISDSTILTGEIDHDGIKAAYKAIDVFVVPRLPDYASDYVTPLKPLEAMAMSRPLIMSDRPVSTELVGDDERGLLFRTGDAENLCNAMERVLNDQDATRKRCQIAHDWVKQYRQWPASIRLYRNIYEAARENHREATSGQ